MLFVILSVLLWLSGILASSNLDVAKPSLRRLKDCNAPLPKSFSGGVCLGNGFHNSVWMATATTGERVVVRTPIAWPGRTRHEGLVLIYRECAFVERLSQGWGGSGIKTPHLMRCLGTNTRALIDSDNNDDQPYTILSNAGKVLHHFVFQADWSFHKVLSVLRQLLRATGALRRASWLHGDLWEQNIGLQETADHGLHLTLMDIGEPLNWMVDDVFRVGMTLCGMLHIPSCEEDTVFKACVPSCHNTVGLILDWARTHDVNDPLDRLIDRVEKHIVNGPPTHTSSHVVILKGLWKDLLSWSNSVQFLEYWHRALVYGSRNASFEAFEQIIINSDDIAQVPSPPDLKPLELDNAPPVHAANTPGGSLTLAGPRCSKASCMPSMLEQICELSRQNPDEQGCGRIAVALRNDPMALECVSKCQYNTNFYGQELLNKSAASISRIPLDEWMICVDAQLSKASCADFAQVFVERPNEIPIWLLFGGTVDGDTWREAQGELRGGSVPPPKTYGVVNTSEDCKQVCLGYKDRCSSVSIDADGCKLGLGKPSLETEVHPQFRTHYVRSITTSELNAIEPSAATPQATSFLWIWIGIFVICALVVAIFVYMQTSARKVPLAEQFAPHAERQAQAPHTETELGILA